MLAGRLVSILMLLQARGRVSAGALAEEFEVSVRTIYRDIDQLSASGVPVYADRGRAGGFRLLEGYRTKLTGLTQSEAQSLFLAGAPGAAADLGLADLLATARLKLIAALPPGLQLSAERVAERFHLDAAGWFKDTEQIIQLPELARALWSERYVSIQYRNSGAVYPRKLGPLGLVLKGGVWYLVAQSGKAIRTYRVASVMEAHMLEESFTRPKSFELVAYWNKSARDYETGLYRESAAVRLSPRGRELLPLLGPHVTAKAAETASAAGSNGWIRCTIPIESLESGVRELLRLGAEVEVLGPAPLRAAVAETLRSVTRLYKRR